MRRFYRKYRKTAIFTVIGAGLGFAYWRFIGCTGGSCPLTANWHTSALFGGLLGMLASPAGRKEVTAADKSHAAEATPAPDADHAPGGIDKQEASESVHPDQKES